jgi:hypothetical protein
MPSVSKAQHNYFEGVAHGDIPASASTAKAAKDYVAADTGKNLTALPSHVQHAAKVKADLQKHHGRKGGKKAHR